METDESTMMSNQQSSQSKRRGGGFMSRFRRYEKSKSSQLKSSQEKREQTPSPPPVDAQPRQSREGAASSSSSSSGRGELAEQHPAAASGPDGDVDVYDHAEDDMMDIPLRDERSSAKSFRGGQHRHHADSGTSRKGKGKGTLHDERSSANSSRGGQHHQHADSSTSLKGKGKGTLHDERSSAKSSRGGQHHDHADSGTSRKVKGKGKGMSPYQLLEKPPPARQAAFAGPPRYDWIDIETAAAIKVQAAFRRSKVMSDLEREGFTTAAIRNRARSRGAQSGAVAGTDDIPSLFQCCGVGLAFGDATEEDLDVKREYQKAKYEEKKKRRDAKEEKLRKTFRRLVFAKKKKQQQVEEAYEIVE